MRRLIVASSTTQLLTIPVMMLYLAAFETIGVGLILPAVSLAFKPEIINSNEYLAMAKSLLGIEDDGRFIMAVLITLIVVYIVKNAVYYATTYWTTWIINKNMAAISDRIHGLYIKAPYSWQLRRDSSELINLVEEGVPLVFIHYFHSTLTLGVELLVSFSIVALLVIAEPTVTVLAIVCLILPVAALHRLSKKKLGLLGNRKMEISEEGFRLIRESLSALKENSVFRRQSHLIEEYGGNRSRAAHVGTSAMMINIVPRQVLEVMVVTVVLSILIFAVANDQDLSETTPVLALFAAAVVRLLPSGTRIALAMNQRRFANAAVTQLSNEYIALESLAEERKDGVATGPGADRQERRPLRNGLELQGVGYRFDGAERFAVKDVSLTIPRGNAVAFVGGSGAGKTTLADLVLGLLEPTEGRILADGRELSAEDRLRSLNVGYVPQHVILFNRSLRRNIAFAIPDDEINDEWVANAVEMAYLKELVDELPKGLDTVIGESGTALSGGQRQRIGIARALYHSPEIIVFDEATSALDVSTEREISRILNGLSGERTLIIIAHRLSTIRNCDRIFLLKDGRLIGEGDFEELHEKSAEFNRLVRLSGFS